MADSRDVLVGVVVPAKVVEVAVADGTARCRDLKRRFNLHHEVRDYVQGLLEQYPDPPVDRPLSTSLPLMTVEDAARLIIDSLEPEHRGLIRQLAKDTQRPLAAYVLSPMLLAKDRGQVGTIIGEWADMSPTDTKTLMPETSTCEYCHQPFVPVKEGQRFCPPPPDESDSCGRKWNMERIHALRDAAASSLAPSPFAPPKSLRTVEHAVRMDAMNV